MAGTTGRPAGLLAQRWRTYQYIKGGYDLAAHNQKGYDMSSELDRPPDYRPARRNGGSDTSSSALRRIMAVGTEEKVHRVVIAAKVTNEQFQVQGRMNAGYDLAVHMTARSAQLRDFIADTGDDPELHQLHSYIKGACTEAIIDLIKGRE